jgi:hypothetical protein
MGIVQNRASHLTVQWFCDTGFFPEQKRYVATTINLRLAAVRRVAFEEPIPAFSVRNSQPGSDESRAYAGSEFAPETG